MKQGRWTFLAEGQIEGGRITVFEPPPADCYCALGLDFSYGLADGDADAGVILDARGRQLATLDGHWGEGFAEILWPVLQWYRPFVVGEKQVGLPTLRVLFDRGYRWMYFNRADDARGRPKRDTLGHHAFHGDLIIPQLRAAIGPRDAAGNLVPSRIEVRDPEVHRQLCAFRFLGKTESVPAEGRGMPIAAGGRRPGITMTWSWRWAIPGRGCCGCRSSSRRRSGLRRGRRGPSSAPRGAWRGRQRGARRGRFGTVDDFSPRRREGTKKEVMR